MCFVCFDLEIVCCLEGCVDKWREGGCEGIRKKEEMIITYEIEGGNSNGLDANP